MFLVFECKINEIANMTSDYSADVRRLYESCYNCGQPLNEEYVLRAGIVVERLFPPSTARDTFVVLAALNLLNAAVKLPWGSRVVTYGYIKGMASCLMLHILEHPVEGVRVYFDDQEHVAYFKAMGVQISFHYIPIYRDLAVWMPEMTCERQQWAGMQLQRIAVDLFRLAVSDDVLYSYSDEQYVRHVMLNFRRPFLPHSPDLPVRYIPKIRGQKGLDPIDDEDKMQSLAIALSFNIWRLDDFVLWRRKDYKIMPVMRYDGKNYDRLMDYLLCGNTRIYRRPRSTLEVGKLYYVSPQMQICCINRSNYIQRLCQNNYVVVGNRFCNLLITYGIARYLAFLHPTLKFVCTLNYNRLCEHRVYYTYNELQRLPLPSPARMLKVWLVVDTNNLLDGFDAATLPQSLIDDYLQTEEYYQEFEVFTNANGLQGLIAYRGHILLEARYRCIHLYNYHAHVQGLNGLWAIYSLGSEKFSTGFVYNSIWYDKGNASIMACRGRKTVVIYRFRVRQMKNL